MSLRDTFDKTLTLERGGKQKDALSGNATEFAVVATDVGCCLWPASLRTVTEFQANQMQVDYEIATDEDISATLGDRVIIDGVTYPVVGFKRFDNSKFGEAVYVTITGRRSQ